MSDKHHDAWRMRVSRRQVLAGMAASGVALALDSRRLFAASADEEIRVGFISPRSGGLAEFGQCDPYILQLVRQTLAKSLNIHGHPYRVTIIDRDSQSSPSRASQLANELINQHHIHLMLSTSTAGTVNPVSDACEAAKIPSLATNDPLEAFFFGRGGKIGQPSPFKWSFDYSFAIGQFATTYISMWDQLKTNKTVGVLFENSAAGNAFRNGIKPYIEKHGYKVVDPGVYAKGTTDFSSQIGLFIRENCQIFDTMADTTDFTAFWRQAAQLHYAQKVVCAQIAKTGLFPAQVRPLGPLGFNLATATYWSPVFPFSSPLTGLSSQQLATAYEKATGHQWNQQVGDSMAVFDAGMQALQAASDPTNHAAIRDAIATLDVMTTTGRANFKKGLYPNTANAIEIGAQWVKTAAGSRYPIELVTVEHVNDPQVPIQRKLVPLKI